MSFLYGAASAVGVWAVFQIWQLFQAPSVKSIEGKCTQPLKTIGKEKDGKPNKEEVIVWGFEQVGTHEHWNAGISDDSPYVSRVEAYLRLIQVPYIKKESQGLMENPRGKVPFANIQGQMVDDSSTIIETLQNAYEVKVDANLSQEDLAKGHLIRQVLFGSLYWVLLHQKFETEFGRKTFQKNVAAKFPPVIRYLICALVFRNMHACLYGSGVGRMSHAMICQKGQADLRCLSQLLGNKKYFFGNKATSYDSDVYCWLVMLFYDDAQKANPWTLDIQKECPNLVEHVHRMRALLYPKGQQ